jgi:hypothetical protein
MKNGVVNSEEYLRLKWMDRPSHLRILSFAEWKELREGNTAAKPEPTEAAHARPQHVSGEMNRLEAKYATQLDMRKRVGEISAYEFEAVKLRLAKGTFLTIDFLVVLTSGAVELHEVKGHWEDDARVKIKVAAKMFPWWTIRGVQWDKTTKDWKYEVFHGR